MIRNRHASSSVTVLSSAAALLLSSAVLFSPRSALALVAPAECAAECVKGFTCQAVSESDCAPSGCAPGQECAPTPCETTTKYECVPAACTADSDCATGMACVKRDSDDDCVSVAPAPSCPPGAACEPAPPPAPCEQKTEQTCVPRYQLPCKVAADCGVGFQCQQAEQCSSSGSAGSPRDPGGSAGVAPPEPPVCERTGEFHCTAELTECNVTSDCPSGWTCVTVERRGGQNSTDPGSAPPSAGSDDSESDSAGAAPADAPLPPDSTLPPPPTTTTVSYCAPPYYDLGIRGSLGGSIAGSDSDSASPTPQDPSKSAGESGTPASETSGGCRTSPGRTGSGSAALLGALGLLGLMRRRRVPFS